MSFLANLFKGPEPVPQISVDALAEALESEPRPRLIDVRTPGEYSAAHAEHAEHAPLQELGSRLASLDLPKDAPVYVICQSGGRSLRACQMLRAEGYDAINVSGGTGAWLRSGLPTG